MNLSNWIFFVNSEFIYVCDLLNQELPLFVETFEYLKEKIMVMNVFFFFFYVKNNLHNHQLLMD